MSACSDNQSTILPFPSSPHWAPTTTTLAIRKNPILRKLLERHGCPEERSPSCPDRALGARLIPRGAPRARRWASHRIKEAGLQGKPEQGFSRLPNAHQAIDIP